MAGGLTVLLVACALNYGLAIHSGRFMAKYGDAGPGEHDGDNRTPWRNLPGYDSGDSSGEAPPNPEQASIAIPVDVAPPEQPDPLAQQAPELTGEVTTPMPQFSPEQIAAYYAELKKWRKIASGKAWQAQHEINTPGGGTFQNPFAAPGVVNAAAPKPAAASTGFTNPFGGAGAVPAAVPGVPAAAGNPFGGAAGGFKPPAFPGGGGKGFGGGFGGWR